MPAPYIVVRRKPHPFPSVVVPGDPSVVVTRPPYVKPDPSLIEGIGDVIFRPGKAESDRRQRLHQRYPNFNPQTGKYEPPVNFVEGASNGVKNVGNIADKIGAVLNLISLGVTGVQIAKAIPSLLRNSPAIGQAIARTAIPRRVINPKPYINPKNFGPQDRIPWHYPGAAVLGGGGPKIPNGAAVLSPNSPGGRNPIGSSPIGSDRVFPIEPPKFPKAPC
ncbi:hypothetical protein [Spirulina sp. 06S082]|uniref:hypothetical protein n=1 Tax=Spirulina sp. 06S082 TaxID=3110248 RepID=UPI002B1F50AB|nr:hypothetical protein [Spirulina sp. 06S082]MEA5469326.1 hypothetical protein [Spirulina sp. 06S082]